ncbi:MAG: GNAT family N-acetyltransferase [Nocardioidaceae bacterium]
MTPAEPGQSVSLRPATDADLPDAADVLITSRRAAEATGAIPRGRHPPAQVHAWFGRMVTVRDIWVAAAGDQVVGVLMLDDEWLDQLYVLPDRAGNGIGSMLLDLAKALRPEGFGLWCFATNAAARQFYRSRGLLEVRFTDGADNEEHAADVQYAWKP